jgi:hypothetical protein
MRRLLVTANVVPTSPILVTLMMEAQSPSEMSFLTRATRCNSPEDALHFLLNNYKWFEQTVLHERLLVQTKQLFFLTFNAVKYVHSHGKL